MLSASSSGDSFLSRLEDDILVQLYRINKTAKCQSMSIDVRQERRCNTCDDQQEHESPTLTPKHTIRIGASCWGGNKQWISYLQDVRRYDPKSIPAPIRFSFECEASTRNGAKAWTLIVVSVGPSRPGCWSEWASVEYQYYPTTCSTYDNTYRK